MIDSRQRCPRCDGDELRRSRSTWLRWPARLVFLHPIRCCDCQTRFWRFTLYPPKPGPVKRAGKKSGSHETTLLKVRLTADKSQPVQNEDEPVHPT